MAFLGGSLDTIWIVFDTDELDHKGYFRTTVAQLPEYVIGTGANTWRAERTAIHTSERSAIEDVKRRRARLR